LSHLQFLVIDALEDVKAQDIQVFDTTAITTLFDRVVMASGTSNRQTRALAKSVHDKVREAGAQVLSIEGTDTGEWVLVDLGDVVVHIMQPVTRDHYRLEDIWGEVAIPLADVVGPFRKKAPVKKAAPKKPSAREPSTAEPTTAKKASAAKPASKKAPATAPAARTPVTKKPAAKKPAAKKAAAKKPAAAKPPASKPARKPSAKKKAAE
jgi:ribosome-associated protein